MIVIQYQIDEKNTESCCYAGTQEPHLRGAACGRIEGNEAHHRRSVAHHPRRPLHGYHRPERRGQVDAGQAHHGRRARDERPDPAGRRGHYRPVHLRARQEGHRLRFPTARTLQGHEGEEAAGHRGRQEAADARVQRVPGEGGPVLGQLPHARGGQEPVRRRGEAHRDRHHPRARPEAGHLRRARGGHRPVELRPPDRDVPRHPRGARRSSGSCSNASASRCRRVAFSSKFQTNVVMPSSLSHG